MGRVIDYQKWMMGLVFNAEKGAVMAVTDTAKTAMNSVTSYVSDMYDAKVQESVAFSSRIDAQATAYNNQLIGLLDKYVDMNILDRNTAANAANVAAGNASVVNSSTGSTSSGTSRYIAPVVTPSVPSTSVDKAVESVYNPGASIIDRALSSSSRSSSSSTSSTSANRYTSGGTYLGKKASWMK